MTYNISKDINKMLTVVGYMLQIGFAATAVIETIFGAPGNNWIFGVMLALGAFAFDVMSWPEEEETE